MLTPGTFPLVECGGTPYEIGRQWGEGCQRNIVACARNSLANMESYLKLPRGRVVALAMSHLPEIERFDPYLVEIMHGQADGAGLPFEAIVAQKCMNDFTAKAMTGVCTLCTAFAATGCATEGGKTLLAQNIDFTPDATVDFLKISHAAGPVQYVLSFNNWTEYTLSSAGFGIGITATFAKDHDFALPVSGYLPKVMRQKSAAEAAKMLQSVARGVACYLLADAGGILYGVESAHDDIQMLQPNRDVLLHTNHYVVDRFKDRDTAPGIQPDSFDRLKTLEALVDGQYGHITPQSAGKILADHAHHPYSICRHIDKRAPISSKTLASFVMVPEEGTIYIARGNPCENGYVRYAL